MMEKKRILLFILCVFSVMAVRAANCPRCHGKGTICVFPKVAEYGVSNKKKKCSICDQYVYAPHYEKCGLCGGSGHSSGSGTRAERSRDAGESLMIYWTSQEYEIFKTCVGQLAHGVKTYIDCSICGGTGDCKYCGGYMNVSLDAPVSSICSYCGGSGVCGGCNGRSYSGTYYKMPEGEEKEQLQKAVDNLLDIAMYRRSQRNGTSTSTAVKHKEEVSEDSVDYGDTGYKAANNDDDSSFWDDAWTIIGLIIIAVIIICVVKQIIDD